MLYLSGALISLLIVSGQILWKTGISKLDFELSKSTVFSTKLLEVVLSPYFIGGVLVYGLATVLFMLMLGKHQYSHLQAVVVSSSLFFTLIASVVIFGERANLATLAGFALLVAGVIFVTRF